MNSLALVICYNDKLLLCLTRRHQQSHGCNVSHHFFPLLLEMGQMSCVWSTILICNCTQTAVNHTGLIISRLEWATPLEMYIFTSTGCGHVQIQAIRDSDTNIQISWRQINNVLVQSEQQCPVLLVFTVSFPYTHSICPSTVRRMTSGRWQCCQTKDTWTFH